MLIRPDFLPSEQSCSGQGPQQRPRATEETPPTTTTAVTGGGGGRAQGQGPCTNFPHQAASPI